MLHSITKRFFTSQMSKNTFTRIPPSVQFYARSYGVDLDNVEPTGVKGMITKFDIMSYIKKNGLKVVGPPKKQYDVAEKVAAEDKVSQLGVRTLCFT